MMGSVKSYLNYTDRKSGDPTLNPGEINHKTLKPQSKYETERLVYSLMFLFIYDP